MAETANQWIMRLREWIAGFPQVDRIDDCREAIYGDRGVVDMTDMERVKGWVDLYRKAVRSTADDKICKMLDRILDFFEDLDEDSRECVTLDKEVLPDLRDICDGTYAARLPRSSVKKQGDASDG